VNPRSNEELSAVVACYQLMICSFRRAGTSHQYQSIHYVHTSRGLPSSSYGMVYGDVRCEEYHVACTMYALWQRLLCFIKVQVPRGCNERNPDFDPVENDPRSTMRGSPACCMPVPTSWYHTVPTYLIYHDIVKASTSSSLRAFRSDPTT
jgi:hypothetical protein